MMQGDMPYFEATIKDENGNLVDLSGGVVSVMQIIIRNAAGTVVEITASFVTDGSDSKIKYQTGASDTFNQAVGTLKWYPYVKYTDGRIFSGEDIQAVEVKERFVATA